MLTRSKARAIRQLSQAQLAKTMEQFGVGEPHNVVENEVELDSQAHNEGTMPEIHNSRPWSRNDTSSDSDCEARRHSRHNDGRDDGSAKRRRRFSRHSRHSDESQERSYNRRQLGEPSRASTPGGQNAGEDHFATLITLMKETARQTKDSIDNVQVTIRADIDNVQGKIDNVQGTIRTEIENVQERIDNVQGRIDSVQEGIQGTVDAAEKRTCEKIEQIKATIAGIAEVAEQAKQIAGQATKEARSARADAINARKIAVTAMTSARGAKADVTNVRKVVGTLKQQGQKALARTTKVLTKEVEEVKRKVEELATRPPTSAQKSNERTTSPCDMEEVSLSDTIPSRRSCDASRRSRSRESTMPTQDAQTSCKEAERETHSNCVKLRRTETPLQANSDSSWRECDSNNTRPRAESENSRPREKDLEAFDHKHFLSVQRFQPYKEANNTLHPAVWIAQFDRVIPPNWPLTYRLEFICGHMEGHVAERMRRTAENCHTYNEFRQAFLDTYWSSNAQERIRQEIINTNDLESGRCNNMAKFFEEFYAKNRYLDRPFTDQEIIRHCVMKFPLEIQEKLAGRSSESVEQFRRTLADLDHVQEIRKRRERQERRAVESQQGRNNPHDNRGRWNYGQDDRSFKKKGQRPNQGSWEQRGNVQWANAPAQDNAYGPFNVNQRGHNSWRNQGGNGSWQAPPQPAQIVEIRPPNPAHNASQAPARN